ncbi:MAG TPA: PAS domain S-box protein [Actinomycetota bacterium]|nr:PAS domain S-box protein [Actinomycetota bacterium]
MSPLSAIFRRGPAWAWFAAVNAVAIAAYFAAPRGFAPMTIYACIGFASGIALLVRARTSEHRAAWYAFAATQLLWASGDVAWATFPLVSGHDAPYPSIVDVFYLAAYPAAVAGVIMHTLRQVGDDAKKVLLDAGMVALIFAIAGWELVVGPYLANAHVAPDDLVSFLYPAFDLALLSVSVVLFHGAGARSLSNRLIAVAIASVVVADFMYSVGVLDGTYHEGIWYDALWLVSYAVWGVAALHPSAAATPVAVGERRSELRPSRLLLPSSFSLLAILIFRESQGRHASAGVLLSLGGLVFLLSLMRVQGLVKELHAELRKVGEQRHSYRTLMDLASDAIFISHDGKYVEANVRACQLSGYTREELLALPPGTLEASGSPAPAPGVAAQLERGDPVVTQTFLARKDASPVAVEVSARLLPDGRLQSIARDVSDRIEAEQALRASEERFRKVFESPAAGMAVASVDGTILQANQTLASLLATSPDRLAGAPLLGLICEGDRELVEAAFDGYADGVEDSAYFEVRLTESGGGTVWVELALAVDVSLVSDPIVVVHAVDQTHARELEARLQQSQKMEAIGELAGGVAHDFNNLLSVVVNYTRFAQDVVPAGGTASRDLDEVVKAAGRGERLVRQLLAFSRRERVRLEDLNVDAVIGEVADLLRRTLRESIELDLDLGAGSTLVRVDPVQLEQVLLNLAVNARDAMPAGGTLRISTGVPGRLQAGGGSGLPDDVVHIVVSDTGSGMSDEVRKRAFEPFFTTKERGSGTGLGLATVYGAVTSWGGDIRVTSAPGSGTTFDIRVPVSHGVAALPETPRAPAPVPRRDATVLVAEDEKPLRHVAQRILERAGYDVVLADTPEAALDLVRSGAQAVDVLLTDVVMPGLSGKDLAEQVLAFAPGTRVLYMSGYPDDIVTDHGLFVNGEAYLQKPFTSEQLVERVERLLASPASPRKVAPACAATGPA